MRWSGNYTQLLSLVFVIFLGMFLRASFFSGLVFDDSVSIARSSWELYSENELPGEFSQFIVDYRQMPNEQSLIILVTGLLYQLLGVTNFSSVIFPVISSIVVGILLYVIGKLWFGKSAGLLAMFFWFILPIGIFLSTNLFSIMPMIALNTLAVSAFFVANEKQYKNLYVLSGAVFLVGFMLDWTYFFASAGFIIFHLSSRLPSTTRRGIGIAFLAGAIIYLLVPPNGSNAANLYYLISLVFENLILFPLLIVSIVYAGSLASSERPSALLTWLAAKSLFLILGARWIAESPDLTSIGMSGYWLDLLVPGILLVAWLFVSRLDKSPIPLAVSIASATILVLFFAVQNTDPRLALLFTLSRISLGLSLLLIALYLVVWNTPERWRFSIFILFLTAFLLGSLTITNDYWRSYRFATDDAGEVLSSLGAEDEITLNVMGEQLFSRFSYLNGFEEVAAHFGDSELRVLALERVDASSVPPGIYVVMTDDYKSFILGSEPENWTLEREISSSDQQRLLLFRVNP